MLNRIHATLEIRSFLPASSILIHGDLDCKACIVMLIVSALTVLESLSMSKALPMAIHA